MNWWFIEDALRNRKGHWAEYAETFREGLARVGDRVKFLVDRSAEPWILSRFDAVPCLPDSIWHSISQPTARLSRMMRLPRHGLETFQCVRRFMKQEPLPDILFVPTVITHHLLGWWRLIEGPLKSHPHCRVLLFFPNPPLPLNDGDGSTDPNPSFSARLFRWLIRRLRVAVEEGRVILGAETYAMRDALTKAVGVPFTYFPHPVGNVERGRKEPSGRSDEILFGSYGGARYEKGSDILLAAVEAYLRKRPNEKVKFAIQWLEDFRDETGEVVMRSDFLLKHPRVDFIENYFIGDAYNQQLQRTGGMVLPYRENYKFRVSRVVIEAMLSGMPVLAPQNTSLSEQASEFGALVAFKGGDFSSLACAIENTTEDYRSLKETALRKVDQAASHFSVDHFRQCFPR